MDVACVTKPPYLRRKLWTEDRRSTGTFSDFFNASSLRIVKVAMRIEILLSMRFSCYVEFRRQYFHQFLDRTVLSPFFSPTFGNETPVDSQISSLFN